MMMIIVTKNKHQNEGTKLEERILGNKYDN